MKKIMFNDRFKLTEAVLSGTKTQTRRIVSKLNIGLYDWFKRNRETSIPSFEDFLLEYDPYLNCPIVAVGQRYKDIGFSGKGQPPWSEHKGWNNKMFVCAEDMPHLIRINNVHIERLQDISEEDCAKEGIRVFKDGMACFDDMKFPGRSNIYRSPREAYSVLIDKISGRGTWISNPWVYVYDFELIK